MINKRLDRIILSKPASMVFLLCKVNSDNALPTLPTSNRKHLVSGQTEDTHNYTDKDQNIG